MKFSKFALLVFFLWAYSMLIGTALTQHEILSLIVSFAWSGLILIVFPVFRKKTEEVNE